MLELDIDRYNSLVATTYAAGLDRSRWVDVLEGISNLVGHVRLALNGHDTDLNSNLGFVSYNYDPAFHNSYVEHYARINPWNAIVAKMPVGQAVPSQAILLPDNLKKTEFYADWIRPQDDIGTGAGITLFRERTRFLRLSANIRFRDQESLQQPLVAVLNGLGRHFAGSFELSRQLAGARVGEQYHSVLEQLPIAVFLLDYSARVSTLNAAADRLQADGRHVTMDRQGRLVLSDSAAQRAIDAAFYEIASGLRRSLGPMLVGGSAGHRPLRLTMTPFILGGHPVEAPLRMVVEDYPIAIVTVDRIAAESGGIRQLSKLFRLTEAESVLAEHLCAGGALREFSAARNVSIHTARNQLKSLMSKVGASRQAELVSILSRNTG